MSGRIIKICYIPGRESGYSRNRVLLNAMRQVNIIVYDCSCPDRNVFRYIKSFFRFLRHKRECDIIFVGFLGQFLLPIVKLFTRKKIIFDAFISVYQTLVFDRKAISKGSIFAKIARLFDKISCKLADMVFLDTEEHIKFFCEEYKLSKNKFRRLWVSSDTSIMFPREGRDSEFIVHFHGEFQPLHGAEYIIKAASFIPEIKFQMIGRGRELKKCIKIADRYDVNNIDFIDSVPYEQLPEYIARASVCLGIFGDTQKAGLVIPHKVYEALAMAKPLITADTPAARELLAHKETAFLCKPADPKSLAEAIKTLHEDEQLRRKIAENGYQLFRSRCSPKVIGKHIRECIERLVR